MFDPIVLDGGAGRELALAGRPVKVAGSLPERIAVFRRGS